MRKIGSWFVLIMLVAPVTMICPVSAQNEIVNSVVEYGPDFDLLTRGGIETALKSLQWQSKLHDGQLQHIQALRNRWQNEHAEVEDAVTEINGQLQAAGLPFPVNQKILDELAGRDVDLQIQVTGMESKIEAIQTAIQESRDEDSQQADMEKTLLQKQVDNRTTALKRIRALYAENAVSEAEVATYEQALLQAQVQLEQYVRQTSDQVRNLQIELVHMSMDLQALRQQRKVVMQQIATIGSNVSKVEKLRARNQFTTSMIELCDSHVAELQIENARSAALIQLIKLALADAEEKDREAADKNDQ